ncbi:hypothetical protein ACIBL3_38710 [Kribbella sp. NPDC050124]|uniref:hypothetical protein n=1 Tax=Kribbella sp. NPDC050124 TaxID=3364114 RepID=UPI00378C2D4C
MELTVRDFERIPPGNLRVPVREFARLWLAAEQRGDAQAGQDQGDWYLAGVRITCRWMAGAFVTFNYPAGPVRQRVRAPVTKTTRKAHEELIARETEAAETAVARGGLPGRPGLAEGAKATFAWAWQGSGMPPIEVKRTAAG